MAASSTTVSVLAPNGRRQTVKVSQNTPLLQVNMIDGTRKIYQYDAYVLLVTEAALFLEHVLSQTMVVSQTTLRRLCSALVREQKPSVSLRVKCTRISDRE